MASDKVDDADAAGKSPDAGAGAAQQKRGKPSKSETVKYRELFRFATPADKAIIIFGCIMAAANGVIFPCFTLVSGRCILPSADCGASASTGRKQTSIISSIFHVVRT